MKKIILLVILSLLPLSNTFANNFVERTIDGYKFRVIKFDTKSKIYNFKVGVNPDYGASDLRTIMEKNNGISAVNGAFFCPADYAECWGQDFTNNERYYKGFKIATSSSTENRVVFAVDTESKPFLYQTDKINASSEKNIYYGISNFPLLLRDGESTYDDYVALGLIDGKMTAKASRNFICHDETKRYIYSGYVSAITLANLPELLKKLGCYNAVNLDAGASSSMIYNGRQIIGPGRDILDAVVIEMKGLDTQAIHTAIDESIETFVKGLEKFSYQDKLAYIQIFTDFLNEKRSNLYNKYSYNTFNEEGKVDGYEIYLSDLSSVTQVYLYNYLSYRLNGLKSVFAQQEQERKQKLKDADDRVNGLF